MLFAGRLLIRSILLKSFHLDDVFSGLSWLLMIIAMVLATLETPLSYRFSAVLVGEAAPPSPAELATMTVDLRRWNVAVQTLFWTSLYCVKFSFMFLYRTVLGARSGIQTTWLAALVYIILTYGVCLIGVFGQCGAARNLFTYGKISSLTLLLIVTPPILGIVLELIRLLRPAYRTVHDARSDIAHIEADLGGVLFQRQLGPPRYVPLPSPFPSHLRRPYYY